MSPALLLITTLVCGPPSVEARLDRSQATLEDVIQLTILVENLPAGEPELPNIPGFSIRRGGVSRSTRVLNRQRRETVGFSYVLSPRRTGTLEIPAITVRAQGKSYRTKPLTIEITKVDTQGIRPFFAAASVSDANPFRSQQIVYTLQLYGELLSLSCDRLSLPKFDRFIVEDLGEERRYETVRDGRRFRVVEIRKSLYPLEPGEFELPAARLSCNVTYPATGRNPIDRFYGRSRTEQKQLRTEPISVRVRDLPPAPSDFSNVVGRVAINTSIDEAELITGNSATQTIFITSNGNLRGFTPPVPEIDGVKIYDDQSKLMLNDRGNEIETSLRMNRAFVPLRSGKLDVPGFSFSYFDPQSERYRTASSPSVRLKVRANPDEPQLKAERSAPAPLEEKTKSADPLSPPRSDSLRGAPTPSPWLVPTMAIALPLAALGLLTFRRRGARRGPTKSLRSTLAPLKDAADLDAELVERTMRGVMALRGGEVFRSLSIDELNHELGAQGVASEDRNHVLGWLRWAEAIRYGGVTRVPPAKKTDLVALLQRLDRYLEDDHAAPNRPGAHPP
ncbi:MAG: BatD family protein [Myxococcota bacterium]